MVEIRRRPLPRHGTDHDSKPLPSFPRFCLPARPLQCRQEEYRSGRATAQWFGRSLLAVPFKRYAVSCELSTGLASVVGDNATEGGPIHQFAADYDGRYPRCIADIGSRVSVQQHYIAALPHRNSAL